MSSRALVVLVVLVGLAGCPRSGQDDCDDNVECSSGEVCGRDHACTDPSNVREVTVTWTVNGGDANAQSCGSLRDFELMFLGDNFDDELAFTPVPCATGSFFVDRLPKRFHSVQLGSGGPRVSISASGTAAGNLTP